jgi:hypothetical protein
MLALVAGTLGAMSALAYCVGRNIPAELRFFEPRRAPTVDEAVITYPIEYSLGSHEQNDVIFLGDSTCRGGIDPAEFERLTGLRAYNLGSQGRAGPIAFTLTAKAYLSTHPPPRVIVYCISPVAFDFGDVRDDMRVEVIDYGMQNRLLANYGPEVVGQIPRTDSILYFIKRGAVSASGVPAAWISGNREDVRDVPLVGLEDYTYRTLAKRTFDSKGFCRFPGAHNPKVHGKSDLGLNRQGEPVTIPDEWTRGVEQLAEICREWGIPLLLRFTPLPEHCAATRDFSPVERWCKDLERACPELTVGQPTLLWYDWTLCWDAYHLNGAGVSKFMPLVADEVQGLLAKSPRPEQRLSPHR